MPVEAAISKDTLDFLLRANLKWLVAFTDEAHMRHMKIYDGTHLQIRRHHVRSDVVARVALWGFVGERSIPSLVSENVVEGLKIK